MKKYNTLSNPPIKEAVIDIRALLPDDFDITTIFDDVKNDEVNYPAIEATQRSGLEFGFKKGQQIVKADEVETFGYRLWSSDRKQIALMTREGFTFSRLSPYTNWENFESEAKRLWDSYEKYTSPISVTRLAVRYINRLEIQNDKIHLSEILTTPPSIPDDLSVSFEGFLNRVIIRDVESGYRAIVTQAPSNDMTSGNPSIILDIDAFYENRDGIIISNIWTLINDLRMFKNDIFFKSVTDKQMEVYR